METWILSGTDVKDARPVVIIQGPRPDIAIAIVWARTTDTAESGVATPKDVLPGLNKHGVIAPRHQHALDVDKLRPPTAHFLGTLPEPYLSEVLALWEAS